MLCQFCEFDIPAEDIELSQRLAKCRGCNQVFTIGLAPVRIFHPSKPEKLKVVNENGIYYLQWSWFHPTAFVMLIFSCVLVSFTIFCLCTLPFGIGNRPLESSNWIALFLITFGLGGVSLGFFYVSLCMLLNKTQVVYDGTSIIARSGPLPTLRNRKYSKDNIQRFEYDVKPTSGTNTGRYSYQLFAVLNDDSQMPLVTNEPDYLLIRYIQWQLEKWLGLPPANLYC